MDTVKKIVRNVKEVAMDYDDAQLRVRDATSNDPVGADERLLARIAHDTRDRSSYNSMFSILWKRITDLHQPSHILKSLILTEYLLIRGDDRFVRDMRTKKNVVKRLTGYKFYRNHEDVGGEVRHQARIVLELLANDDKLEKMRKDCDAGIITKIDRYDRSYNNKMQNNTDEFSGSSEINSPVFKNSRLKEQSLSFDNLSPDTPNSQADSTNRSKATKKYSSEMPSNHESKKKRKPKKKKDGQDKQKSFESSLSDDDDVEHVTKGISKLNNTNAEIDLVTNQGAAPVDWIANLNFTSTADNSQQQFPALSFQSGGQIFQGTPIDPATPKGSEQQDGFAFDDALEIGSDDDNEKGFWNVDKKLVDLSDLNAHGPPKKPQAVTGAAPGKTLAEIAAANRNPAAPSNFSIQPLPSQQPVQQQLFGQQPQFGYAQASPNPFGQYGYNPALQPGMYQQQMPYNPGMGMGYNQPSNMYQQPMQQPYGQPPQGQPPFQNPPSMPNPNQFQEPSSAPTDPFASLWKP